MSLQDFKDNLRKIKEISTDYERFLKDRDNVELDIRNLKAKYSENKIEREVFSEYNKRLESLNRELEKIKQEVSNLCKKNNDIINDEMKNVI